VTDAQARMFRFTEHPRDDSLVQSGLLNALPEFCLQAVSRYRDRSDRRGRGRMSPLIRWLAMMSRVMA